MAEEKLPDPENLDDNSLDHVEMLIRDNQRMAAHIQQLSDQLTSAMILLQQNQQNHSAASRLKLPTPPSFSGKRGDSDTPAEEWLFLVEQHLNAQERTVSEKQAIIFVGSLLTDVASSWYLSYCKTIEAYSYADFRTKFLDEFQDRLVSRRARDKLRSIEQGSRTVEEYVGEFRSILRQIKDMNAPDQIHAFVHGLRDSSVRQEVEVRDPNTLDDAIVIASTYAAHLDRGQKQRSFKSDRMDLDALEIPDEFLDLAAAMYYEKKPQKYTKLTDRQRTFLIKTNGCFYCRKPYAGHQARDCPQKKNQDLGKAEDQ